MSRGMGSQGPMEEILIFCKSWFCLNMCKVVWNFGKPEGSFRGYSRFQKFGHLLHPGCKPTNSFQGCHRIEIDPCWMYIFRLQGPIRPWALHTLRQSLIRHDTRAYTVDCLHLWRASLMTVGYIVVRRLQVSWISNSRHYLWYWCLLLAGGIGGFCLYLHTAECVFMQFMMPCLTMSQSYMVLFPWKCNETILSSIGSR